MSHKKIGADRFSRFDVYWIQTNKQTNRHHDRQAKFIYRWRVRVGDQKGEKNYVRYFPKGFFQSCPLPILAAALRPHCSLRRLRRPNLTFRKLPLGKLQIWKVASWEVALGKMPLGKYLTTKEWRE